MALDNSQDIKINKKASKKAEKVIEPISTADSNVVNHSGVKEKKKKSRAKKEEPTLEPEIETTRQDNPELLVPDKKRKKRKRGAEMEGKEPVVQEEAPAPPQKKHKNRTEFADPRVDGSLSSQARKGLEYAFLQMNKPAKWKFNKARQNWLIRNIWSTENIPELYMPLVCKYLSEVQGGSREKLKSSCQSVLNPEEPKVEAESPTQTSDEKEKPEPGASVPVEAATSPSKRKVSFGPLITAATPAPPPQATDIPEVPEAPTSDADAAKLAVINRARAQMVLDVLQ